MTVKSSDSYAAFATLKRYEELVKTNKPTLEQANEAVKALCQVYNAETEEELISRGNDEIIERYKEIKDKIMSYVEQ
jgi:hypothetical protein